ncbi:MAG: CPBP family intramembrane metalloprotease, partial [Candidatus Altiarchaeales archaeon]|nr:CPBP family intramembrane metalloprotease [Candidatus Altiarchaeales archaeon]
MSENLFGSTAGLISASIFFAIMHTGLTIGGNPSAYLLRFAFVLLVGMFYGYCYQKTGNLLGISVSHGLLNVIALVALT